ncbi:MAG TPA: hypothetical protein VK281_17525 [Xanthobacteraceae bacterium]|nr:hypothetical protein [Xanthobacteraceae bacterium]
MSDPIVRLDRSKPHGIVYGVIEDGVHFHQDGLPFNAHGHLVAAKLTEEQRAKAENKARRRAKAAPGDDAAEPVKAASRGAPDPQADDTPGDVNLDAWLRGEQKYLFDAVRTAIRSRYNRDVGAIADAVEFLVLEESLVPIDQVTPPLRPK